MNEEMMRLAKIAGLRNDDSTDREYVGDFDWRLFGELVVANCANVCEEMAENYSEMADSKFVTAAGRQLYEGMYGGANNCSTQILDHFGVE